MERKRAKQEAKRSLISGFRHHNYQQERRLISLLLQEGGDEVKYSGISLDTYVDVLAPTPFRAMQNGVICLIAVICRLAISLGADIEQSFALSDYFVCEVENKKNKGELEIFIRDVYFCFSELVRVEGVRNYSQPVTKAVRYIRSHVYEPIAVNEIALRVDLNPRYFSTLFKKEVGQTPSQYIRAQKMSEALTLLDQGHYSITEVAEMLGYCSLSHFSSEFKNVYGRSPKNHLHSVALDPAESACQNN
ncbi:MAG: AraC family transcriptional regulator [Clostridiales bacterium]|jgi:AraC-like DNA-binding protein|nr:AraC family transcriptional regulator [Clostridiales bacterium]